MTTTKVHFTSASEPSSTRYDAIFGALSNDRCRLALYRLSEADVPLALADLAREITTESCRDGEEPNDAAVQSNYLGLYHSGVPKLVDAGLVVHDPDTDAVELSDGGRDLGDCLELARQRERTT